MLVLSPVPVLSYCTSAELLYQCGATVLVLSPVPVLSYCASAELLWGKL